MKKKKHRQLRDLLLGNEPKVNHKFPYKTVYAYLHIEKVPDFIKNFSVLHSFHTLTDETVKDHMCSVEEYIEKVSNNELKGWAQCTIPAGFEELDKIALDYVMVDSYAKGQVFLKTPITIGETWPYFEKTEHSIPSSYNNYQPSLTMYIFSEL